MPHLRIPLASEAASREMETLSALSGNGGGRGMKGVVGCSQSRDGSASCLSLSGGRGGPTCVGDGVSAEAEMVNALRKSLGPFILLDSSGLVGQTLIPSCLRRGAGGDWNRGGGGGRGGGSGRGRGWGVGWGSAYA